MKYSLLKRISAFVLAFALVMTTAFNAVGTTQANAAKKATVSAKGATVTVGASKNIKVSIKCKAKAKATIKVAVVKGATGKVTKKVTNSNAKKAAKTCKSTIKVTGKKAGKVKLSITPYINGKKAGKAKKITVTVKAAATTAAPATTTTAADVTTEATTEAPTTAAPATTEVPASGEALKSVSLSNKTPKVGDVITVVLNPAGASDVASYAWFVDSKEVSGNATSSYTVTEADTDKVIKAVVTNKDGVKFESDTTAAVIIDNTTRVEIVDKNGFQSTGTALYGDTLDLTFGSGLGVPAQITWYINEKLVGTFNSTGGGLTATSIKTGTDPGEIDATGQCYALIKNEDGKTFKSNVVEIVNVEAPAVLSDFSLSEDYANNNIDCKTTSQKFVASVTLNKDYAGKFYLIPDGKDYTEGNAENQNIKALKGDADTDDGEFYVIVKKTAEGMTADKALALAAKKTLKRVVGNGKVQYMFKTSELTRGTNYKLIFDQAGVDSDDLSANVNKQANATTAVLANYVKSVTELKIEDKQSKANKAGWTAQVYAGASKAEWLKDATDSDVKIKLWSNTGNKVTGGTEFSTQNAIVVKGKTATPDLQGANSTDSYIYGILTIAKGICSSDAIEIKSVATEVPGDIVTSATLEVSASDVSAVKVNVNNVKGDAKVYLIQGLEDDSNAIDDSIEAFKADNKKHVAVLEIKKGDTEVVFGNVLKKVVTEAGKTDGNIFGVAIKSTTGDFADYYSTAAPLTIEQQQTSYELSKVAFEAGTTAVVVKDQFGTKMTDNIKPVSGKASANFGNSTLQLNVSIANDGKITLTPTEGTNNATTSDEFWVPLDSTYKLHVKVTSVTDGTTYKISSAYNVWVSKD